MMSLSSAQVCLITQVALLVLLMRATNAVSERSASALCRIKTYLHTTMTQARLNNVMVLYCTYIHKHLTNSVNNLQVLNEFVSASEEQYLEHLLQVNFTNPVSFVCNTVFSSTCCGVI